jgi:hypothetical protein
MAVWQVEFYVVPRRALATAPAPLTPAILRDTDWWAGAAFPKDYGTRLAAVGSPDPSASAEHQQWGEDNGNRADVWSAGGRVRRVTAQADVRRLDSKFGAAQILFVRAADAVLVRSDGLIVEPTIAAYAGALRGSAAWRYASDPAVFRAAAEASDDDED